MPDARIGKYANHASSVNLAINDYSIGQIWGMFGTNDLSLNAGDHVFCSMDPCPPDEERLIGYVGIVLSEYVGFFNPWTRPWKKVYRIDNSTLGDIRKIKKISEFIACMNDENPKSCIKRAAQILSHQAAPILPANGVVGKTMIDVAINHMV